MDKVTVLIEGYANKTSNGWVATNSTTLIQTERHNIIVDPGINKNLLLERLSAKNLNTGNIDYVFLTHYHPDHSFLAQIFNNATVYDGSTSYKDDREVEYSGLLPDTNIKVIPTPGHTHEHASLVIQTDDLGTVVVAADVFWWTNQEKQDIDLKNLLAKEDALAVDRDELTKSRKRVLEIADWVIPGHGKMFQVKR